MYKKKQKSQKPQKKVGKNYAKKRVLVNIVLDESGSMDIIKQATIDGFNGYIKELKKNGVKTHVSLTKFDSDHVTLVYKDLEISKVEKLNNKTYIPGDCTPLYDAIGTTISETKGAKDADVLFLIITDGYENASKMYDKETIEALIKKQEKKGWRFIYMGANQDARTVGTNIGVSKYNNLTFTPTSDSVLRSFGAAATGTLCFVGQSTAGGGGGITSDSANNLMVNVTDEDGKVK